MMMVLEGLIKMTLLLRAGKLGVCKVDIFCSWRYKRRSFSLKISKARQPKPSEDSLPGTLNQADFKFIKKDKLCFGF